MPAITEASRRATSSAQRGLAMLDLLLVVTILGIVTAVAVRADEDDEEALLDAAARAIAADLVQAQQLAIGVRRQVGLLFDTATTTARFVMRGGERPADVAATLRAATDIDATERERLIAARARSEQGLGPVKLHTVSFNGKQGALFAIDGSPSDSGVVELRSGRTWLRIRLQAPSGRITITAP